MNNQSPVALWHQDILQNTYESLAHDAVNTLWIDMDGPVTDIQTNNNVQVPQIILDLPEQFTEYFDNMDPLQENGNFSIGLYVQLLDRMRSITAP